MKMRAICPSDRARNQTGEGDDRPQLSQQSTAATPTPTAPGPSPTNSLPDAILTSWSRIAQADMSVSLYRNLVRIAMRPDGWRGPGSRSLTPTSLRSFLEFWSTIRASAAEPELALAPDGSLHAEWFKSNRQRLDVRFAGKQALFGLLTNNSIVEGVDSLHTVAEILSAHPAKPLSWSAS